MGWTIQRIETLDLRVYRGTKFTIDPQSKSRGDAVEIPPERGRLPLGTLRPAQDEAVRYSV